MNVAKLLLRKRNWAIIGGARLPQILVLASNEESPPGFENFSKKSSDSSKGKSSSDSQPKEGKAEAKKAPETEFKSPEEPGKQNSTGSKKFSTSEFEEEKSQKSSQSQNKSKFSHIQNGSLFKFLFYTSLGLTGLIWLTKLLFIKKSDEAKFLELLNSKIIKKIVIRKEGNKIKVMAFQDKPKVILHNFEIKSKEDFILKCEETQLNAGIKKENFIKITEEKELSVDSETSLKILTGLSIILLIISRRNNNLVHTLRNYFRIGPQRSASSFGKNFSSESQPKNTKKTDINEKESESQQDQTTTPKQQQSKPASEKKSTSTNKMNMFNNIFGFGGSRAKKYDENNKINVTFKDVAGLDGAKEEMKEFVEFLKNPEKFRKLGAKIPKGALLAGPPGTGKTLLAKACAGEAGVSFYASSGSEFVEMFVGVGASRVRDLFSKAKADSPAIIFIDEIDAIGKHRAKTAYNDERESTLNELFVQLDGFGSDTNVIVFAATNRKDALDRALIRPGRFDRMIDVSLPSLKEREDICKVHLGPLKISESIKKEEIAAKLSSLTMGMSGADIASICNESALLAARKNKTSIGLDEFYEAFDRMLTGLKRQLALTEQDRRTIAFHEAGHALTGWFLEHAQPLLKISIVPRSKGMFGFTAFIPDEIELYSKEQLVDLLCVFYGGRAAEDLFMGTVTTGASNDLNRATKLARHYIASYGMSEEFGSISLIGERPDTGEEIKFLSSSHTYHKLDKLIHNFCQKCYERTKNLLKEHEAELRKVAEKLVAQDTLELNEIIDILGEKKSISGKRFDEYLADLKKKNK